MVTWRMSSSKHCAYNSSRTGQIPVSRAFEAGRWAERAGRRGVRCETLGWGREVWRCGDVGMWGCGGVGVWGCGSSWCETTGCEVQGRQGAGVWGRVGIDPKP
jgi:hypothetical protein